MPKRVLCDTCHVRSVEVSDDFDGTEFVICEPCIGDEPVTMPSLYVAREVALDDAIHADIEDRGAA